MKGGEIDRQGSHIISWMNKTLIYKGVSYEEVYFRSVCGNATSHIDL